MSYILVVDDDADSREVLAVFLKRAGYQVYCADSGKEALAGIISDPPAVAILDLCMPEMGGVRLLEILRSYLRLRSLPVVVLTGLPDGPDVERARGLQVTSILKKGEARFEDILGAIQRAAPDKAN